MVLLDRSTLPNAITLGRILLTPVIFFLIFVPGFGPRLLAFVLFLAAALSDVWDGHLARKYGWITEFGQLMDPLADKLLLAATFVPFYILSHRSDVVGAIPFWGELPLWVLLVVFGREALITALRAQAVRQGTVIPAATAGKHKMLTQSIFIGSLLLWYAADTLARDMGWTGTLWRLWSIFHGSVVALSLALAIVLTVYSMIVYMWRWRRLMRGATG